MWISSEPLQHIPLLEYMTNPEDDDFMCQEQYVLELPDLLTEIANNDPSFEFDLVFDGSGTSGRFVTKPQQPKDYVFRVFTLPLVTESYTSTNNDIFFKNADVSQIIVVFDKEEPPQLLKDYEYLQQIQLHKLSRGAFPVNDIGPHGLTPPSRWAPLQLYPQFPTKPKFAKPPPMSQTELSFDDINQTQNHVDQDLLYDIEQQEKKVQDLKQELVILNKQQEQARSDGHQYDEQKLPQLEQKFLEEERKLQNLKNKRDQQAAQQQVPDQVKPRRGRSAKKEKQ